MKNELMKALKPYPQWVYWKTVEGRKVPVNIETGRYADTTDPGTWAKHEAIRPGNQVGFVLSEKDPFIVIDLDHCIGAHGQVKSETTRVLLYFQSYTEVSPSGTGFHIWMQGKVPSAIKRKTFEIYSSKRYITITGNPTFNCPLANCQLHLDKVYEKYGRSSLDQHGTYDVENCHSDLRKLFKVSAQMRRIWNLDCGFEKANGSPDCSSYDMALAGLLKDWSGEQIVWALQFFREQHGFAPKHEKAIALTIDRAKNST
jgi:primase-polymerase (primpol)-like protein